MMRRPLLATLTPAVLALFLVANGLPRDVLVVHTHPGDALPHVHPFDDAPAAASSDDPSDPVQPGGRNDLREPTHRHYAHMHWRQPFRWAAAVTVPPLAPCVRTVALADERPAQRLIVHAVPTPARAPPPVA